MAENGKKPLNIVAFACRTRYLLVTEDQGLKVLITLRAMKFEDGHGRSPL